MRTIILKVDEPTYKELHRAKVEHGGTWTEFFLAVAVPTIPNTPSALELGEARLRVIEREHARWGHVDGGSAGSTVSLPAEPSPTENPFIAPVSVPEGAVASNSNAEAPMLPGVHTATPSGTTEPADELFDLFAALEDA